MRPFIFDIESYPDYFVVVIKEYLKDNKLIVTSDNIEDVQKIINMMAVKTIVFTGFNIKGYDLPILEAIINGYKRHGRDPQKVARDVHAVSNKIVVSNENVRFTYNMCSFTDIQDDLVVGSSLKGYESNKGRSIEETNVPFGTTNLTQKQKDLIIEYCGEDVLGTESQLTDRWEYVMTKVNIARKFGLDQYQALKQTIASLSANVLVKYDRNRDLRFLDDPIKYELHDRIRGYVQSALPQWLVDKFLNYDADIGLLDRDFVLFNNYVTIGEGGAHSVHIKNELLPNRVLTVMPKKGRIQILIDISSYYPNTAITYGYQSRAISDKTIFPRLIDEKNKLSPIAKGPTSTREVREALTAVKALINATVGAYKQKFNRLYDPQQNVNVCFTGQLLILAIANELYEHVDADIIQVNTDGIILEFDDDKAELVKYYIRKWEVTTGLKFDATVITRLWQNNVNNYIMEAKSGKIKIVGRWLDYTLSPFSNLFFRVVKKAVFDYLVRGRPIATTIRDEEDPLMFLYTAKTGNGYKSTVLCNSRGEVSFGKVNRIYASTDTVNGGRFYKVKGQARGLVPDCPDVAKDYNSEVIGIPSDLDYNWYIDKAEKMLNMLIRVEL